MIRRSIREWEYLPVDSNAGGVSRAHADSLLAVARAAGQRLQLGGEENGSVLQDGRHRLRAQQVVGVVAAPEVTLEILPKIDGLDAGETRRSLIHMLARTLNLPIADGALTLLDYQCDDLLEAIIRLFCQKLVDALRKGLPRRYIGLEDDLPVLRGRLNLTRQFTVRAASPQLLASRYEELSPDIALNQILKAAAGFLRRIARSAENQRLLMELEFALADVSRVPLDRLSWERVVLDRTNSAWCDLLTLARLLLGERFQTTSSGSSEGFALLFEMNTLFEEYIGRTLRWVLARQGLAVALQDRRHRILINQENKGCFELRPDIVVRDAAKTQWIIDTKWKRLNARSADPKYGVAQADVYQMVAYAQAYRCPNLMLLYPYHSSLGEAPGRVAEFTVTGTGDTRLVVGTIDVAKTDKLPDQLLKLLVSFTQ